MNETSRRPLSWNVHDLCYKTPASSYAVIILNAGLKDFKSLSHIIHLWKDAAIRISVDGGTNDFYSLIHKPQEENDDATTESIMNGVHGTDEETKNCELAPHFCDAIPLPDIISGDFDSIDSHILDFYSTLGVTIAHTPDQDQTDFTKALIILGDHVALTGAKITHAIVIAAINSSRFDHVLSHLSTLYKINSLGTGTSPLVHGSFHWSTSAETQCKLNRLLPFPIIMMSEGTLLWLLDTGSHSIRVPESLLEKGKRSWCGYSSFTENVIVTTSGLKWDVHKRVVAFGKLISTSNTYAEDSNGEVLIECSSPLLWFMGWDPP